MCSLKGLELPAWNFQLRIFSQKPPKSHPSMQSPPINPKQIKKSNKLPKLNSGTKELIQKLFNQHKQNKQHKTQWKIHQNENKNPRMKQEDRKRIKITDRKSHKHTSWCCSSILFGMNDSSSFFSLIDSFSSLLFSFFSSQFSILNQI